MCRRGMRGTLPMHSHRRRDTPAAPGVSLPSGHLRRRAVRCAGWHKLRCAKSKIDDYLNVQHREERGDDCAVLCCFCATRKRTIRTRGNGESPNAPPAQYSGECHTHYVSLSLVVVRYSNGERTRQSREDDVTISTNRPEYSFRFFNHN